MAHFTELSAGLQAALDKAAPARSSVEVILDPEDVNLDLSDYLAAEGSLRISKSRSILPYSGLGRFTPPALHLDFVNQDDVFNCHSEGKPFFYYASRLYADKETSDTVIQISKGDGGYFNANDEISLDDGLTLTHFTVQSVDTSDPDFDALTLDASGSVAYSAGTIVEIKYLPGRKVQIKTVVAGEEDGKITQVVGTLSGYPALSAGEAKIEIDDRMRALLGKPLTANWGQYIIDLNGRLQDTIEYNRVGSSTGTLDNSGLQGFPGVCPIGQWSIKFKNPNGDYKLTDPGGRTYEGNTGSTLQAEIHGQDSLWIQPHDWEGTFDEGDQITFRTVLALGYNVVGVTTIPAILKSLLTEDYGAGLGLAGDDIDYDAFDAVIAQLDEARGFINFSEPTTVLKAVELLQAHINATVFSKADGTLSIKMYFPTYRDEAPPAVSPDEDVMSVSMEDLGRIDRVEVQFDFDPANSEYRRKIVLPELGHSSENGLLVQLPGYNLASMARFTAERIWSTWRKGVRSYSVEQKWNYGLAVEIGDLVSITSANPLIPNTVLEIYSVEKDLLKQTVRWKGFAVDYAYRNYAFTDVGHKLDSGKVIF